MTHFLYLCFGFLTIVNKGFLPRFSHGFAVRMQDCDSLVCQWTEVHNYFNLIVWYFRYQNKRCLSLLPVGCLPALPFVIDTQWILLSPPFPFMAGLWCFCAGSHLETPFQVYRQQQHVCSLRFCSQFSSTLGSACETGSVHLLSLCKIRTAFTSLQFHNWEIGLLAVFPVHSMTLLSRLCAAMAGWNLHLISFCPVLQHSCLILCEVSFLLSAFPLLQLDLFP